MAQYDIVVTIGDAGDTEALLPVIRELHAHGVLLTVYADPIGAGKDVLINARVLTEGIPCTFAKSVPSEILNNSRLLLAGSAFKAPDLCVNAMLAAQKKWLPVVLLEDFYHTGSADRNLGVKPDHIIVMDESAAQYACNLRSGFRGKIHVMGNPAHDRLSLFAAEREKRRAALRDKYGLGSDELLVGFSASSVTQIDMQETLEALANAIGKGKILLLSRFHPADSLKSRQLFGDWLSQACRSKWNPDEIGIMTNSGLIGCVDVFLTQYSTAGVESVMMGVPTLFLLLPSCQKYLKSRGGHTPFFPQIEKGAAKVAWCADDVELLLGQMQDKRVTSELAANAQKHFPLRGGATERVVNFILELLK